MKNLFLFFVFFLAFNFGFSQSNLINAQKPSDIDLKASEETDDTFLKYDSIDLKDILWSKVVYEYIDLDQKLNFPLLFPLQDDAYRASSRRSLWKTIFDGIMNDEITELYQPDNDQFIDSYKVVDDPNTPENEIKFLYEDGSGNYLKSSNIRGYNIKGIWYFDKVHSELRYRLLAIQPYGDEIKDIRNAARSGVEVSKTIYHWIWYPSIREILHKSKVFNDRNNNNSISFDELLVNRRFNSFIYKYDNVYGNRSIENYISRKQDANGNFTESEERHKMRLLLESERIKKEILDFEIDMWGY